MEKGYTIPVLDHGFVRYVDHMGDDKRIVEAARISYRSPSKGDEQDQKLLEYLWKNKHCYHGDMEVLTLKGWKKWKDCSFTNEEFLIPDPKSKTYSIETLPLEVFDNDEELYCFNSQRMSYAVTYDHRMWFKGKYEKDFSITRVQDMSKWGHFEPSVGYKLIQGKNNQTGGENWLFNLIGFYLGDGFLYSKNILGFRLKKQRKIDYLRNVLEKGGFTFETRLTEDEVTEFKIDIEPWFTVSNYVDLSCKAKDKFFRTSKIPEMTILELESLFDGLVNSDGSLKKDRQQIEFSSTSEKLIELFEGLAAMLGYDAHRCSTFDGCLSTKAYSINGRTSLESRAQYHSKQKHNGKVYCVTSSTGLLVVRGGKDKFAFICGNTSPFEMVKLTLNIKMPVFIARQYTRHRMQNLNEVSARYTELPNEFYIPTEWRAQDTNNKQQSIIRESNWNPDIGAWSHTAGNASDVLKETCNLCYMIYQEMLDKGISREMARMILPVNIYTEIYCCWDLKNLLHFITLRDDGHAQAEIQEYSRAIKQICNELFPGTMKAYEKFKWKLIE